MYFILIALMQTFDLLAIFSKVYNGTHTDLDYVEYRQVKWFSIVPFRGDGEVVLDQEASEDIEEVVDIDGTFLFSSILFIVSFIYSLFLRLTSS